MLKATLKIFLLAAVLTTAASAQDDRSRRPQFVPIARVARIVEGDVVNFDIGPAMVFYKPFAGLVCGVNGGDQPPGLTITENCRLTGKAEAAGEYSVDLLVTYPPSGEPPTKVRAVITVNREQPELKLDAVYRFRSEDHTLELGVLKAGEIVTVTSSQGYFYDVFPGYWPGVAQIIAGCPTDVDGLYATLNGQRLGICGVEGWTMQVQIPRNLESGNGVLQVFGLRKGRIIPSNVITLPIVGPSASQGGTN